MRKHLLITALAAALAAGPAGAHALLVRAAPRVGATIAQSPAELRLWLSEAVELPLCKVALSGPAGAPIALGPLRLDPADRHVLVATVMAPLGPGTYRIDWQVVAVDSHRTQGDFAFTVKP